jgi:hypothetical protein
MRVEEGQSMPLVRRRAPETSFVRQRAYPISKAPIPVSVSTLYRWEKEGRIELKRVGAQTWITDEEIDRILSGKVDLPTAHIRNPETRPEPKKRTGRPRKSATASA